MSAEMTQGIEIVALHGGLLGLVLFWLAMAAGRARRGTGVLIGDGGDPYLIRAMRGQANFTEYAPLCLLLLLMMAALGAPAWELHAIGAALVLGRVLHAAHFTRRSAPGWQRAGGTILTFVAVFAASLALVVHALPRVL